MKRILILVVLILVLPILVNNLYSGVVGSKHDLGIGGLMIDKSQGGSAEDRVCVFCHTPHGASTVDEPLWNRTNSTAGAYGTYNSSSFDGAATIADIFPGPNASMQCMSCHDGTVAVNSLINPSNEFGTPTMGSGTELDNLGMLTNSGSSLGATLTDDHPVNFNYWTAYVDEGGAGVSELKIGDPAITNLLSGGTNVQCSSCHDVHDDTFDAFLTIDPTSSQLCTTCHDK